MEQCGDGNAHAPAAARVHATCRRRLLFCVRTLLLDIVAAGTVRLLYREISLYVTSALGNLFCHNPLMTSGEELLFHTCYASSALEAYHTYGRRIFWLSTPRRGGKLGERLIIFYIKTKLLSNSRRAAACSDKIFA